MKTSKKLQNNKKIAIELHKKVLHHTVEGSTVNMMTMMIVAIAVIEKNILQTTNKFNLKNPSKGIFSYIFLQVFVSE